MPDAFVTGGSGFLGRHLLARLADRGDETCALARSDSSAAVVREAGADPVRGGLADVDAMAAGMAGCDVVFHAAAKVGSWGDPAEFHRVNVAGTGNVLSAARRAGVDRLVHVSTEAVLFDGSPLVDVDETYPYPDDPLALYPRTKGAAERHVLEADDEDLTTVAVRPRFVWGPGDTTLLPELVEAVESGRFVWIGGGRHRTSTCHVRNAVEGLLLAAEEGAGGHAYFVTDGVPVEFRWFVTALLETQGVEPPDRSLPRPVARAVAALSERAWRTLSLPGTPPLTRTDVAVAGLEATIDDTKARRTLGYEPVVSVDRGLAELAA